MGRTDEFQAGHGKDEMIDLFHGTSADNAKEIQEAGFHGSYASDYAQFTDHPDAARAWAPADKPAVVHLRAHRSQLEDHGDQPASDVWPAHRVYGLAADEEDEEMPGHLWHDQVHCIDGDCTKPKKP